MPDSVQAPPEFEARLRRSVLDSLRMQPMITKQEAILHGPRDTREQDKIRLAVTAAFRSGLTLGDYERNALQTLDPEQWNEASRRVESHLDSPLAIPERDLAVYVPRQAKKAAPTSQTPPDHAAEAARLAQESLDPEQAMREEIEAAIQEKRSLQRRLPPDAAQTGRVEETHIESEAERDLEHDLTLAAAIAAAAQKPVSRPVREPSSRAALPQTDIEPVVWDLAAAMDPSRLTPLPLVAAALEAVGLDEEQFGFLLSYGTLAPEGRDSEFKITGLGMAEFSRRAAEWFKALGASKFPVQVIDDGSGALTVYLLDSVPK